jgi:hypothetical protein
VTKLNIEQHWFYLYESAKIYQDLDKQLKRRNGREIKESSMHNFNGWDEIKWGNVRARFIKDSPI